MDDNILTVVAVAFLGAVIGSFIGLVLVVLL